MKELFYKIKQKNYTYYCIILIITLLVCIPLLSHDFMIIRDDGVQHIYRVIGSTYSIKENPIFPQIMSGFCNGFGYSWNIFYSPFTAYIPIIFSILANSYIIGIKLFMFTLMLFSAVFMYMLVLKISKSKNGALMSAILYLLAPYHLTDMYSRLAIAELASFTFLPIVFIGLYDIFEDTKKQSYYLSIGAIGLLLSHNVITVYTAMFCLIYCLIYIQKLKDKEILKKLLINIGIILLVTSFYWVPLLEHRFATDYEVFRQDRMYNTSSIKDSKLTLAQFIYRQKKDRMLTIGIPISIGILMLSSNWIKKLILMIIRHDKKICNCFSIIREKKTILTFLCFGIISTIMASEIFPFEYLPNIFKMLQFPWRMVEFAVFFFSIVIGCMSINLLKKRTYKIIATLASIAIVGGTTYWSLGNIIEYMDINIPESVFFKPYEIKDPNTVIHFGCATFEYLPTKAYKNFSYIVERNKEMVVINGEADIGKFTKENGIGNAEIIKTRRK